MIYQTEEIGRAAFLFGDCRETMVWSCLQGTMGCVYADDPCHPASAAAALGDFCFFAGEPNRELALLKPFWRRRNFMIAVPLNHGWAKEIERSCGPKARKIVRYAMKKEGNAFDQNRLTDIVKRLSPAYAIGLIDEPLFDYCKKEDWCRDFVSQFPDYSFYRKSGLGVIIRKEGVPVSGASSYSFYSGGIEIEIDTKPEFRRKGLALACGAKLILECLHRGLYPSWDAQNLWSVSLAEKLGYHLDYAYDAYEIEKRGSVRCNSAAPDRPLYTQMGKRL